MCYIVMIDAEILYDNFNSNALANITQCLKHLRQYILQYTLEDKNYVGFPDIFEIDHLISFKLSKQLH